MKQDPRQKMMMMKNMILRRMNKISNISIMTSLQNLGYPSLGADQIGGVRRIGDPLERYQNDEYIQLTPELRNQLLRYEALEFSNLMTSVANNLPDDIDEDVVERITEMGQDYYQRVGRYINHLPDVIDPRNDIENRGYLFDSSMEFFNRPINELIEETEEQMEFERQLEAQEDDENKENIGDDQLIAGFDRMHITNRPRVPLQDITVDLNKFSDIPEGFE